MTLNIEKGGWMEKLSDGLTPGQMSALIGYLADELVSRIMVAEGNLDDTIRDLKGARE